MKYLSLFSGIGGFELGLLNSKHEFENVGFSEIDKYAKSIYLRHFPRHKDLGDATEIRTEELPDFDFLVGGFPCQAFSLSGKRLGFDDTRGTMFFEIARILKDKRPKYFLFENVKGLLSHDGGRTYKEMLRILAELGYDVEWEIYNSKDYGVPQNRERLYIKGYLRRECGGEILSQERNRRQTDVRLRPVIFNRQVRKRVHSVDYGELSEFLRKHKKAADATLSSISEELDVGVSEVGHWFRSDDYFAPPPPEVWNKLKELLNIRDDRYDAFITEFEWVDGVYEMDKRAYDEDGLGSTLTCNGESLVKINVVDNTSPTGHWGDDVFGDDELTRALTATNYKHPLKVAEIEKVYGSTQKHRAETDGEYSPTLTAQIGTGGNNVPMMKFREDESENINNNFTPVDENRAVTTTKDGDYLCLKCTTPRVPLDKKLTNYVLEKKDPKIEVVGNVKNGLKIKTNTSKGYDEVDTGDGVRLCHPSSTKARGRTQKGQTGALSTSADWGTVERDYRIRKLTPVECERLQNFPDNWTKYGKDDEIISNTQRYKCLGNAVTTSVVTYIADTMFVESVDDS